MGPEVCFDNVNASIGGREILSDIRAVAPAGGATVLIGPNGAGKTTLLHCLWGKCPIRDTFFFLKTDAKSGPVLAMCPKA